MKYFLKEYGLITVLLVISVGGYLALGDQKEDFLSDPLNAIESRFAELMTDDEGKREFAESYAVFKTKVMSGEVTPEQVESVAASVLNLAASNAELTPEDAKMVIAMATEPTQELLPEPRGTPEPGAARGESKTNSTRSLNAVVNPDESTPGRVISEDRYREMGRRMADAFALSDELTAMKMERSGDLSFPLRVRFENDDGLAVVIDSSAIHLWNKDALLSLTTDLDQRRMLRFKEGAREDEDQRIEKYAAQRRRYAIARMNRTASDREKRFLATLERLNKLRELGMVTDLDTTQLRLQIEANLRLIVAGSDSVIIHAN